jgi:HPr kinase/phosphorylase
VTKSGEEQSGGPRPPSSGPEVAAGALATDPFLSVSLRRLAGEAGLERPVRHPRVQKSGLALVGHFFGVVPTRVQILGETELSYLETLSADKRSQAARGFFSLGLSCVVITHDQEAPRSFVAAAEASGTPLFVADARSSRTINALHAVLDDRLAPQTRLHGVLVDVFGIGILLLGKSGIGKSECALELVMRGHRLVADDIVRCEWHPPGMVFGSPVDLLRHHIEIRGLGVLNIKAMFGVTAVRERKRIDVVIRLVEWNDREEYDRLGVDKRAYTLLGSSIRELVVPVRPGRDMGSILEMAARNELLRRAGHDTAQEFLGAIERQLVTSPAIDEAPTVVEQRPESLFPPAVREGRPPRAAMPTVPEAAGFGRTDEHPAFFDENRVASGESSAWIPAARPKREDDG